MIRPVRPGSRAIAAGSQSFLIAKAPSPAVGVGLKTRRRTRPGRSPRRILGLGRCLVLACAFVFLWPHSAASGEPEWGAVAVPLRTVNLNPFHLLYGLPASSGARVLPPGSSEAVVSMDVASHLAEARSGAERVVIDGETYRHALALRHGFRDGWEYLFEVSAVAHRGGAFDGFIEDWHEFFGLPRGGRDRAPRDRLAVFYADGGGTRADIDRDVFSLGDVSLGVGYRVPLQNDGLAVRASVKLPTGDEDSLAGSGGCSASLWAETSGALPWSSASRAWP